MVEISITRIYMLKIIALAFYSNYFTIHVVTDSFDNSMILSSHGFLQLTHHYEGIHFDEKKKSLAFDWEPNLGWNQAKTRH